MKNILIIFLLAISTVSFGQKTLTGFVTNEQEEPLIYATVNWKGTTISATTDVEGYFEIERGEEHSDIEVSYVGYDAITIHIEPTEESVWVEMAGAVALTEVEVVARQSGNFTSTLETRNVESITSKELRKAPCCNLGESFETNAAVDVAYADAITGSREIQLLGLRGIYTQLLIEKRPALYGLAAPYALDYIAGTWLTGIQISKGASTVQTGYGGMAGAINSELEKPNDGRKLHVNLFGSHLGRGEANVHINRKLNNNWSTGVLLHGSLFQNEVDHNGDGFMSMPQKQVGTGMFRLFYNGNDPFEGQLNVHVLSEDRTAGQMSTAVNPQGGLYQIRQNNDRVNVTAKLGYLGFDEVYKSAGSIWSATYHRLNSSYGNRQHRGEQRSFYSNLFYSTIIKNSDHKIMYGGGYQYDDYQEFVDESDISRTEHKTGAFAEYNFKKENFSTSTWWKEMGLILGLRADYHNQFGLLVTPRLNFKFNFTEDAVVRVSGGRGYRTANVVAENISFLASSRQIVFVENLDIESSWNYGANFTQKFNVGKREGAFSIDAYRTQFTNQVILDVEDNHEQLLIYNLDGKSFSNAFLTSLNFEILPRLDVKVAYKFNDVRTTYQGDLRERPLVAKHRGLAAIDYETANKKWRFNASSQIVGSQRLQDINVHLPDDDFHIHENGDRSPSYAIMNAQVTFAPSKKWEFYAGSENLTGYHQHRPIIGASDPFGEYFDATRVYAPTMGRVGYAGLRYTIE